MRSIFYNVFISFFTKVTESFRKSVTAAPHLSSHNTHSGLTLKGKLCCSYFFIKYLKYAPEKQGRYFIQHQLQGRK